MDQNQKDRIVEQAMQMFVAQGIKSVRMDDIAAQLGVSKRTLYETFSGKEELLYLALRCYFERDRMRWERQTADADNVLEAIFIVLRDVMASSELTSRMMENLRKFYPAVYDKMMHTDHEQGRLCFREMLERGISEGLFTTQINIDLAIAVLYHTTMALVTHRSELVPDGVSDREAFMQVVSTFLRGVATLKGAALVDDYLTRYTAPGV